jgi:ATP-dependent RNA helicase DDX18/HAS1
MKMRPNHFKPGPRRRIMLRAPTRPNFFLSRKSCDANHCTAYPHHDIHTMTTAEIDSKKRKRKHKSKKGEEPEVITAPSNGAPAVEKPRKKSKKVHTPEPEVEDEVEQAPEDGAEGSDEDEEDEEKLNQELKKIAAKAKAAKKSADDGSDGEEDLAGSGANAVAVADLPSGTSIPTIDEPTRFDELKLSDRTMEAIKSMGFESMTEIQRKAIPPLLR